MKQVEQEREMIVVGLQTLEKARDWYLGQLSIVEEKMRDVGRNGQLWVCLILFLFAYDVIVFVKMP